MKRILLVGILLLPFFSVAHASYIWTSAIPTEIHIVPQGLILIGDFDQGSPTCATGVKAILLLKGDLSFDAKLSMALTAKATGKRIESLIVDHEQADNCVLISAHGYVPIADLNYWRLK